MKTKIKSSKNVSSHFSYFPYCFFFRGFLFFVFFVSFRFSLISQTPGEWTCMHGDNTPNSPGVFGTQGVANPANKPPAMYEPCEWTDNNGNFWLFGGIDNPRNGNEHTALWKYIPFANQWTWMKGSSTFNQPGVYGVQGIFSPANYPGSRGWGVATWVDSLGNLWLFGGAGYDAFGGHGSLNDLWKYDISTNEWAWIKGPITVDDPGSYGTQGISVPSNLPPARSEASCTWTDNAGNLWLYGGYGANFYSDLWKYDISAGEWTWMHGTNAPSPPAVYGIQGVAASANTPGGRWAWCSWTDLSGDLWLFGGRNVSGNYSDLWKYNIAVNQWTWMKGTNTFNSQGNYGTKCVPATNNRPPARFENRAQVRDACGNFWNFGGGGNGCFDDLWHFNVSSARWTWVSGNNMPNQAAVYGTQGISNPANKPGAKFGSVAWMDKNGYIWVFGGSDCSYKLANDLFRYVPDSNCIPVCNTTFSAVVTSTNIPCNGFCDGTATAAPINGASPYTYSWNTIPIQTTATATGLCAGTYTVTVTDAATATTTVTVTITQPILLTATATATNSTCGSNNGTASVTAGGGSPSYTYSWNPSGQTTSTATSLASGPYTATVTDGNGCTATQTVIVTSNNTLSISVSSTQTGCTINNGTAIATPLNGTAPYTYSWSSGQTTQIATGLGAGTYTITATDANGCAQIQTVTITTLPGPIATASTTLISITSGAGTTLTASGGGTYSWSPSTGLSCITCSNPVVFPSITTVYCVIVIDTATGCTDSACVTVLVQEDCSNLGELYLPSAFSPNNDGENDKLLIYYGNIKCIKNFKLVIYNRWGEKIFATNDPLAQWDGMYKSKLENTAVFAYYLKATLISGEQISKKGNVSLIR